MSPWWRLEVNPNYAHVRFNNGRETTVSLRHIALLGDGMNSLDTEPDPMQRDPQELDVPNPPNVSPLLQSTTENSATKNSVPAISLPPFLNDSRGLCQKTLTHKIFDVPVEPVEDLLI